MSSSKKEAYIGENKYEKINRLAARALYENVSRTEKEKCLFSIYNKLVPMQTQTCRRSAKYLYLSKMMSSANSDMFENLIRSAVNVTFTEVLKKCQKVFAERGEKREFMKEFNSIIDIYIKKDFGALLGDESAYKKSMISHHTRVWVKKYGAGTGISSIKYVVGRERLERFCETLGVPQEETQTVLDSIYNIAHIDLISFMENDDSESEERAENDYAAQAVMEAARENDTLKENILIRIENMCDKVIISVASKTDRKYIKYFWTLKIIKAGYDDISAVEKCIDLDLYQYCQNKDMSDQTTILAEYLGKQRETVRKNLRKAEVTISRILFKNAAGG